MKLLRAGLFLLSSVFIASLALGQNLEPAPANKPAPKPKDPALTDVADVPGLPRVLLIGDSISMGYTLAVRGKLAGVANVHRPTENCGDTARGLIRLDAWLGKEHWDVIHFNFGLHDLKYLDAAGKYVGPGEGKQVASPELYAKQLREITQRLKTTTGARLIFATTTPVPPGTLGRVAGDEKAFNIAAVSVMKELGVPVDDLCAYVAEAQTKVPPLAESEKPAPPARPKVRAGEVQLPFNVHFTPEGYDHLADLVVGSVKAALTKP